MAAMIADRTAPTAAFTTATTSTTTTITTPTTTTTTPTTTSTPTPTPTPTDTTTIINNITINNNTDDTGAHRLAAVPAPLLHTCAHKACSFVASSRAKVASHERAFGAHSDHLATAAAHGCLTCRFMVESGEWPDPSLVFAETSPCTTAGATVDDGPAPAVMAMDAIATAPDAIAVPAAAATPFLPEAHQCAHRGCTHVSSSNRERVIIKHERNIGLHRDHCATEWADCTACQALLGTGVWAIRDGVLADVAKAGPAICVVGAGAGAGGVEQGPRRGRKRTAHEANQPSPTSVIQSTAVFAATATATDTTPHSPDSEESADEGADQPPRAKRQRVELIPTAAARKRESVVAAVVNPTVDVKATLAFLRSVETRLAACDAATRVKKLAAWRGAFAEIHRDLLAFAGSAQGCETARVAAVALVAPWVDAGSA